MKKSCGIYEIESEKGRLAYKIFTDDKDMKSYLKKNKGKSCNTQPIFAVKEYKEYENTQVRKLEEKEVEKYMRERERG
jgi:hypothetical protein